MDRDFIAVQWKSNCNFNFTKPRMGLFAACRAGLLVLAVALAWVVPARAQFLFKTNAGTIVITGYTGPGGDVVIPSTTNGLPVTVIGIGAFTNVGKLDSIVIPNSVTNLGAGAFGHCINLGAVTLSTNITALPQNLFNACSSLTNVTIPNAVTNIGASTFFGCASLKNITIPSKVTMIGESAFSSCVSLTNVVIPAGVGDIAASAFFYCTVMSSVTIPKGVGSIETLAFEGCVNLPTVTIPSTVTNITPSAFADCVTLTNISVDGLNPHFVSAGGVLFSKDGTVLMQCPGGLAGTYAISNSVKSVGDYAFFGCMNLMAVTIPNGVTNIGQWGFDDCVSFTNISIPASVIGIGDLAFRDCWDLQAIEVDPTNSVYSSIDGVLFNKNASVLIQFPAGKSADYVVPLTVQQIGDWAFADCPGLTEVTMPSGLTNIMDYAFWGCTNVTSILFAGNAPAIGLDLFEADHNAQVYYEPGATGWAQTLSGIPAVLWNAEIQPSGPSFGVGSKGFGFSVAGATNLVVVVEACTNFANATWVPVATNSLAAGTFTFIDPGWASFASRFYRLSPP